MANGPVTALLVVALVFVVNQVEGDVMAPLVLGRALSLHALVVLLALAAGAIVAGVIGALLAVAVAWTVVTAWNEEEASTEDDGGEVTGSGQGRDRSGLDVQIRRGTK